MGFADSLHAAIARIAVKDIFDVIDPKDRAYFRKSREDRFGTTLEAFTADRAGAVKALAVALFPAEQALKEHAWLGGEAPDYADYALFGTLMWPYVVCREPSVDPMSAVGRWFERMLDLFDGFGRSAPTVRG